MSSAFPLYDCTVVVQVGPGVKTTRPVQRVVDFPAGTSVGNMMSTLLPVNDQVSDPSWV